MKFYRYLGDDHTQIRLTENGPKTKVVQGEIVSSDLPETNFLGRRFEQVDEKGKKIIATKASHDGVSNSSSDMEAKSNIPEAKEEVEAPEAPAIDTAPAEGVEAIISKAPEATVSALEPKEATAENEAPVINVADELPANEAADGTVLPETVETAPNSSVETPEVETPAETIENAPEEAPEAPIDSPVEMTEKEEKEIIKKIKTFEKEEDFKSYITGVARTPKIIDAIGFMQDAFEQA